jgi:hypothetical protein
LSEYTMEHHEYVKGLHKQIAELEADKAELVSSLDECKKLLNGHSMSHEYDSDSYDQRTQEALTVAFELVRIHNPETLQPAKEQAQ